MLSIFQAGCALILFIGLGGWWVARSLQRDDQEQQIEQTLDALSGASIYWSAKLTDPTVRAYAQTSLLRLDLERGEVLDMQTALAIGGRLTVRQLVRLDKLVSAHLAASSALVAQDPVAIHAH
jgi:BMFP domain-containing protein YqiC